MTFSFRTLFFTAVGFALVGGLLVAALREDPLSVELVEVARGDMTITVDAEGKTRVKDIYEVTAPISGTLLRLPLSVGDPVTSGETIVAEVEPASIPLLDARSRAEAIAVLHETEAQITFAEAEIMRADADRQFALSQFNRIKSLTETGAASLTGLEDASLRLSLAEAAAVSAEARLAMAEAARERAEAVLQEPTDVVNQAACCLKIPAPSDGVILSQPNVSARPIVSGEPLLSVGDPSQLEVVVELLSADATRLNEGAAARLERWGGDQPLEAVLRRIEPGARTVVSALGIEEQRVDALLDIVSPPSEWRGLGHGYAVFVRIEEIRETDVLLVPLSAVFRRDGTWYAFVVLDGVATQTMIELGRRDGRMAVVLGGLSTGDKVIAHPVDTLADGRAVIERERF